MCGKNKDADQLCSKKTKALISCAVTAQLICVFVFAYANCWFSDAVAILSLNVFTASKSSYYYILCPSQFCHVCFIISTGAINEMLLCQDKSALQVILVSGGTFDSFISLLQNTSVSEIFF